jgi:alkylhydroperoxidase/carboxymuconolactone decarboxylase family protein YurZ
VSRSEVSLADVRAEALPLIQNLEEGEALTEQAKALIGLAVRASATVLDMDGARRFAEQALDHGVTAAQLHETLVLVSGLGAHTLMEGSRTVAQLLRERQDPAIARPPDERQQEIWQARVGNSPYWKQFESQVPGFLESLFRLSPEAFEAVLDYCALPWRTTALDPLTKELISIAVDASPTHRYLPGMRLNLGNAAALGAGKTAVLQTLDIAAESPPHRGIR